jgi:hypothetical protein
MPEMSRMRAYCGLLESDDRWPQEIPRQSRLGPASVLEGEKILGFITVDPVIPRAMIPGAGSPA